MKRIWLLVTIIVLGVFPAKIFAQEKNHAALEVSPAYLDIAIEKPDEVQTLDFTYTNHANIPLSLQMFPIDFKQADDLGAIQMLQSPESYSYSLASFLTLEADQLTLDPGQKKTFTVTVRNRQDLSPGGHYAAVVAKILNTVVSDSSPQVSPAVSSLILLRKVGGERFNLSLKDINWPENSVVFDYPNIVDLTFQNEGNIHLIPYGRIDVRDIFGRLLFKGIINTGSAAVFPESRRRIYVDLDSIERSLPISINTIHIDGQDSIKKVRYSYRESFIYVNPVLLLIGILLMVGVVCLRRRNVKKH